MPLIVAAGETMGFGWRLALGVGAVLGAFLAVRARAAGVHEPEALSRVRSAGPMPTAARVALVLVLCVVCVEWSWAAGERRSRTTRSNSRRMQP